MDPSVLVAATALVASVITAFLALRGKRGETRVSDDANLRDDQRELIGELRLDSTTNREARINLQKEVDRLRKEMREVVVALEKELDVLRRELEQTRIELEQERLARRAGEAGLQAEHQSRTAGASEIAARQAGDQARQDVHDEIPPHPHGAPEESP